MSEAWPDAGRGHSSIVFSNRIFIDPSNLAKYGPVAAISEAEAIDIANASRFGLGSYVLTGDPARGERIAAQEIEGGTSFVNASVTSDPRMSFGGVKQSGYVREFVNIKSVLVG